MAKDLSKASAIVVYDYFLSIGFSSIDSKSSVPFKEFLFASDRFYPGYGAGVKPPKPASFTVLSEPLISCDVPTRDF